MHDMHDPPESTMLPSKKWIHWVGALALTWVIAVIAMWLLFGCGASTAQQQEAETAYATEQTVCLSYPTHNTRVACINAVRARWAADGGAP